MALISVRDVCWGVASPMLLEKVTLQIEKGERIGLLGRNGTGKTTLLKLISGERVPDSGEVWRQQGITVSALEQDIPAEFDGTIFDIVAAGFGKKGKALSEYNRICRKLKAANTPALYRKRDDLQRLLDDGGGWELSMQVDNILSRTHLDSQSKFCNLSAGMKRRALFARALARTPDVLLLDEPTNHLDIASIIWMEEYLRRHVPTLLFVSHDRVFLKNIATRIVELDRGRLFSYACDYRTYLNRKQAALEAEERQNSVFDKKLATEEAWIRQGVKARRTRNEGRVSALGKMREAHRARRKKSGNVRLQVQEAERTGKLVIEANDVCYDYGGGPVIQGFSTIIMRGDKVGIIGPNGVGKTTLLAMLLKEIPPDSGSVRHGTRLQVAYFDQLRSHLDEQKTVRENIGEGNDFIIFNDQKRHVISYLQDFLFSPERCHTPVHVLSGGEKNRLLLAKLFTRPANVLVMDEPTNDLDAETLELLEELLFEFKGTLLLVSHDRAFLNNVVSSTLAFEYDGKIIEYAGGYDEWLRQRPKPVESPVHTAKALKKTKSNTVPRKAPRLGYMQQRELDALPQKIDALEAKQQALYGSTSDPEFFKKDKKEFASIKNRLLEVAQEIEAAYLRWEELERIRSKNH